MFLIVEGFLVEDLFVEAGVEASLVEASMFNLKYLIELKNLGVGC